MVVYDVCVIAGGIYKERYEKMVRELSFTKKRLQQQHDEELETEHASKKGVEKRVGYLLHKPVLSGHSKVDKAKVLKTDGSLMQVESIAEWSILQYF